MAAGLCSKGIPQRGRGRLYFLLAYQSASIWVY